MRKRQSQAGFTLIEILIAICIFLITALGVYFTYANLLEVITRTRTHTLATSLHNKEIEIIRNLPYDSVGLIGGAPAGVIAPTKTVTYEGQQFTINAFVRNIDDAFDGKQGQNPNDTAPADYRLIEIQVTCPTCFNFMPIWFTTWAAPQNLETATNRGSLFINVFDASGKAISNASVLVRNTSVSPSINLTDTTNSSGSLQLVDIPTSTTAYQITITKTGYSSSMTYLPGDSANPNPIQPHATVASQQITAISFAIDRVSTIAARTQDYFCQAVPSVSFTQSGQKLIGANPNVLLYSQSFTTDSAGEKTISGIPWDTYAFTNTSADYDLAGSIPLLPLTVNPNTSQALTFVVEPKASSSLLVTVVDEDNAPVADVSVNISKTGFSDTKLTGERFLTQTAWTAGTYSSQDGNLDDSSPATTLRLLQTGGVYPTSTNSYLVSNAFDMGTSTTNFHAISWNPGSQPSGTSLKFQLASSDGSSPYVYVGPDNTSDTYYTNASSTTIGSMHNGKRYLRYKAFLNTTDESVTPSLQDLAISFSSGCVPSSQAFWGGLSTGTYNVTATKTGYTTASSSITVGSGWHEVRLIME